MQFLNGLFSGFSEGAKEFVKNTFRPILDLIKKLFNISSDSNAFLMFLGLCLLVVLIIVLVIIFVVKKVKANKKNKQLKQSIDNLTSEVSNEKEEESEEKEQVEINEEVKQEQEEIKEEVETEEEIEVKEEKVVEPTQTTRVLLGKFEVFPVGEVFMYRLKASNGEVLVVSEMYKTTKGALSAIETVKKNIETGVIQINEDKHGLFQFKLFATNKRLLVNSANYTSYQNCENASESFKRFVSVSPISILDKDPENYMEEIKLMSLANKKNGKLHINEIEDEYEFLLKASNGVLLCKSSTYKTKNTIANAIASFKEACKKGKFYVVKDKNDTYQFKLYSDSGRCVIVGEAYKTKAQAISAANSVASFVTLADVIDNTIKETV